MTTETVVPIEEHVKVPREEILADLFERDGYVCQHPDCLKPLDPAADGTREVTIDHWIPQSWAFENGWTYAQVWALSNLKLMHKSCNAKKGSLLPNPDGTLPERVTKSFRFRRDKRLQRPEVCTACESGRLLQDDEVCSACGSGPMPERFPRWKKMNARDCDHELFWCPMCSIGLIERPSAASIIFIKHEGGDD